MIIIHPHKKAGRKRENILRYHAIAIEAQHI